MLKSTLYIWKLNLISSIEYKLSFVIQIISMVINDIFFTLVWFLFFQKFHTIGGIGFSEYIPLHAIILFVYSFVNIPFNGVHKIGELIVSGGLDSHLLLPKNSLLRIITGSISISAIGDLIFGILLLFLVPNIDLLFLLKFILFAFLGGISFLGFIIFYQSLSFYIGSSRELSRALFEAILGPSHYPSKIFEETFLKYIFLTIVPVYFVAFYPYNLLMNFNFSDFLILFIGSCFILGLGVFTFYNGLARYESGNSLNINN